VSDGDRFDLEAHIASRHGRSMVQSPTQKVTTMASQTLAASAFKNPAIALSGVVDYEMYGSFASSSTMRPKPSKQKPRADRSGVVSVNAAPPMWNRRQ
jgi:hypothetical protein